MALLPISMALTEHTHTHSFPLLGSTVHA